MSAFPQRGLILCCLLAVSPVGFSRFPSPEPVNIEVVLERIERVNLGEAHFALRVINRSNRVIFTGGYDLGQGPVVQLLFLEQWHPKRGWEIVTPCLDMPPPALVSLNPGEGMSLARILVSQRSSICKVRTVRFQTKFRFRLEYFDNDKQARAYIEKLPSRTQQVAVKPRIAVSETFEIPPPPKQEQ